MSLLWDLVALKILFGDRGNRDQKNNAVQDDSEARVVLLLVGGFLLLIGLLCFGVLIAGTAWSTSANWTYGIVGLLMMGIGVICILAAIFG